MYGFEPQFHIPMLPTAVPTADERREDLRQAREDATAALTLTAERMKEYYDRYVREDRKSTRLNSSHSGESRMPSSA